MKCFAIIPSTAAASFPAAAWISLTSGAVLLTQDSDYASFSDAVTTAAGTLLPIFYDPTPLTAAELTALAPLSLPSGANMLSLAKAAALLNPLLSV